MYAEIKIGAKTVPMEANAATPFRFKQIFGRDFLALAQAGLSDAEAGEVGAQLAFIMAMQGAKQDMHKINVDRFYDWLGEFEPNDVYSCLSDVMDLYNGNTRTLSVAKKKDQ